MSPSRLALICWTPEKDQNERCGKNPIVLYIGPHLIYKRADEVDLLLLLRFCQSDIAEVSDEYNQDTTIGSRGGKQV